MPAVPLSQYAIQLRPEDNVAVVARNLCAGSDLNYNGSILNVREPIRMGHKIALSGIGAGEAVYKYGQIIGFASQDICAGEHVHVHNLNAGGFARDYAFCQDRPTVPI